METAGGGLGRVRVGAAWCINRREVRTVKLTLPPPRLTTLDRGLDIHLWNDDHNVMRYPKGHKENVGTRIVRAAAGALRQDGIDAVSIPKLMKLAGLTHGGFYVHFRNRDELIAKAVAHAAKGSLLAGDRPAAEAFDAYLSKEHALHPEHGCVLAALGAEGARQKGSVRRAFAQIGRSFLRQVERRLHPEAPKDSLSDEALATASRMVGAVVLARLVHDDALAERILGAAKRCQ